MSSPGIFQIQILKNKVLFLTFSLCVNLIVFLFVFLKIFFLIFMFFVRVLA